MIKTYDEKKHIRILYIMHTFTLFNCWTKLRNESPSSLQWIQCL